MATRIAFETGAGRPVRCVVLTDGAARGTSSATRDRESLAVLGRLGVLPHAIDFLGGRHGIKDGTLVRHLDLSLMLLNTHAGSASVDQIFCLAWEGGHPDHDAAHLVALAFARERQLLDRIWQFPLYHGKGMPRGLFRVMSRLDRSGYIERRIPARDAARIVRLPFLYRSQHATWVGLFPEAFAKLALLRREIMRAATAEAVRQRPHAGTLFYERRYGIGYDSWRTLAEPFIRRRVLEQ